MARYDCSVVNGNPMMSQINKIKKKGGEEEALQILWEICEHFYQTNFISNSCSYIRVEYIEQKWKWKTRSGSYIAVNFGVGAENVSKAE